MNNITFTIDSFDVDIKEYYCSAICYRNGNPDICQECLGLEKGEKLNECPYNI